MTTFFHFSELFLERHENISILFADICKFTEMTTTLSVDKLVETLNDLFGKFDDAADVSQDRVPCTRDYRTLLIQYWNLLGQFL